MPWHVTRTAQCPAGKPWGVILDATGKVIKGGCHETKSGANDHMAALYANTDEPKAGNAMRNFTRRGRGPWYSIKNLADGPAVIRLFDEIGRWGVTAQDFTSDLAGVKGPLELHLNSPGGDVFDGLAIYNTLRQRPDPVHVIIDGIAASAVSFIAQAASPGLLEICSTGQMMIHDAEGMGIGNARDFRELADLLDTQSANIATIYAERSGRPAAEWRDAMQAETWYVGQEAVAAGLADKIHGPVVTNTVPAHITDASYDDSTWDGSAAMAGCSSAADYRAICAGEHTAGSPDERQHWALPHHKSPGAAPNRNGTNNALSQLPKTQDLASRSAAEDHLRRHAAAWSDGSSGNHADSGLAFDPAMFQSLLEEASK